MSSGAEEEIKLLKERIGFLEREILRLSSGKEREATLVAEGWEVVEESKFSDQVPILGPNSFEAESGPPELPLICKNLAERNLRSGKHTPLSRARAAFCTGFWARIAIETHTPFTDSDSLSGLTPAWWVLLRGAIGGLPVRSQRKSDCIKAAWTDADLVLVAVASITELHILCAGAGLSLPQQIQWRSQQ